MHLLSFHDQSDDTGLIGESPYIGRARYKANRFAKESEVLSASPSQVQIQSVPRPARAEVKMELNHKLDHELAEKEQKVAKGETICLYCSFCVQSWS